MYTHTHIYYTYILPTLYYTLTDTSMLYPYLQVKASKKALTKRDEKAALKVIKKKIQVCMSYALKSYLGV